MSEFKRVRNKATGHEYSVRYPDLAEVTVIDERAVDVNGDALPAKPKTTEAEPVSAKKQPTNDGEPVTTPKEGLK